MIKVSVTDQPFELSDLIDSGNSTEQGCDVIFTGKVRGFSKGKKVKSIDYEAYDSMAESEIYKICREALERWKLNRCIVYHRTGEVPAGGIPVIIITSSAHREEAYLSSKYIIDEIKNRAPIWKREIFV